MFISDKYVDFDGLANVLNLYGYYFVTQEEVDCAICAYDIYCESGLYEWFFTFNGNVMQSDVCCKNTECHADRQVISLPVCDNNDLSWEQLLEQLMESGGVHLPDQPWNNIIQQFVNQHGKSMRRVLPGPVVYNTYPVNHVFVKSPVRKAMITHFECTKKLFLDVARVYHGFMDNFDFNNFSSAKNYHHAVEEANQLLFVNLFNSSWVINRPLNLAGFENEKYSAYVELQRVYQHLFDSEKQENACVDHEFNATDIYDLMVNFLDSIPRIVYEQHLTEPVRQPYACTYAQAVYDISDWRIFA